MASPRVLILCTGNSARSQMTEALLRKYLGDELEITSAGLDPKPVNPFAIRVMEEIGIDIRHHRSKDVKLFLGQHFSIIITVCSNAEERCPTFPGNSIRLYWPFEDPAAFNGSDADTMAKFREIRDHIDARVRDWMLSFKLKQMYGSSQ